MGKMPEWLKASLKRLYMCSFSDARSAAGPIISWMLSPRHGGYSLEKAQTKALPLTVSLKNVDGLKPDLDVMQSKAGRFPGHMQQLGRLINRENDLKGVRALLLRAVVSFSKYFLWHLASIVSGNSTSLPRGGATLLSRMQAVGSSRNCQWAA